MAFLPLWVSVIKEHKRFSSGRSFLIISLSPEGREGTCPVSPRIELGSLLPKPVSHPSSLVHSRNPHLPPLNPRFPVDFPSRGKLSCLGRKEWVTLEWVFISFSGKWEKLGAQGVAENEITEPSAPRAPEVACPWFSPRWLRPHCTSWALRHCVTE